MWPLRYRDGGVFIYERFRTKNEHFRRLWLPKALIYRKGGFGIEVG